MPDDEIFWVRQSSFIATTLITYNITHPAIRETHLILLAYTYFTQNSFQGAKFFLYTHASKSEITACPPVELFGLTFT